MLRNSVLLQGDLDVLCISDCSIIPGVWDLSWNWGYVISMSTPASIFVDTSEHGGAHMEKTIATSFLDRQEM